MLSFSENGLPNKGKAKENQKKRGRILKGIIKQCVKETKFSLHKNLISVVNDKFVHLGVAYNE